MGLDKLDELARKAVNENENSISLKMEDADRLWGKINKAHASPLIWVWKAAVIGLVIINSILAFYLSALHLEKKDLQLAWITMENEKSELQSQLTERQYNLSSEKNSDDEPALREKAIEPEIHYIITEKIEYRYRDAEIKPSQTVDSLLLIIQEQENKISAYTENKSDPPQAHQYPENFVVAFSNEAVIKNNAGGKNAGVKFQLSILNRE